jgi:hypothetical protein
MRTSKKSKKTNVSIDLPAQNIWKELQKYEIEANNDKKAQNPKKLARLLDHAFELLLGRLIRQN